MKLVKCDMCGIYVNPECASLIKYSPSQEEASRLMEESEISGEWYPCIKMRFDLCDVCSAKVLRVLTGKTILDANGEMNGENR